MRKPPLLLGLHARPGKYLKWLLAAVPFILVAVIYVTAAHIRHAENPRDKLLPTPTALSQSVHKLAFSANKRTGEYMLWSDTAASLKRLFSGIILAAIAGLLLGLNLGLFPGFNAVFYSFLTFFSMIPPLAILPILFIVVGIDEAAKITLIFIGVFPLIARDTYLAVKSLPQEQVTKAITLGASQLDVVYRVILPQIMPRLINSVRLSLGAAWLFLIAAEAIAAADGLGYRIFLVRRYLAMDIILPYVLWITLLGFCFDWLLRQLNNRLFRWYQA